jgi:predicted DNA-binding transcriptional regulator AlpA
METPRKAPRFAVLESSLLARKGQARPAIPPGNDHDDAVTRADAVAVAEAHHTRDVEHNLGELIIRPALHNETVAALHGQLSGEPEPAPEPTNDHFFDPEPNETPFALPASPKPVDHDARRPSRRRESAAVEPRGLDREQAAQYIGLSRAVFARLVSEDILPEALPFGRRRVWDRRALDKALDQLSGIKRQDAADKPDAS